jgi:hypothetical protein
MEVQGELNRIANTVGLGEALAANIIASSLTATTVRGMETVGALNLAAGTVGLDMQGAANDLAGTVGLGTALALSKVSPIS